MSIGTLLEAATPTQAAAAVSSPVFDWSKIDWLQVAASWAAAALIVFIGYWIAKWISRIVYRALTRGRVEHTLAGFLRNMAYAVMMVVVVIAALQKIGVPTTSVLAIVGAAGLAVGLALKDSLSNIASGVMLIVLRPFRDGDYVQAAGLEGTVEEIRIFQTRMRTADNRLIVLPNSMITTSPILNFTAKPRRRADITVGVGYDDDLKKARQILLDLAAANPLVLKQPAPDVLVDKLGESSVDLILQAWVGTPDFGTAKSQLTEAVRTRIIEGGLSIPYPQRDLHVYHHGTGAAPLMDGIARSIPEDRQARGA